MSVEKNIATSCFYETTYGGGQEGGSDYSGRKSVWASYFLLENVDRAGWVFFALHLYGTYLNCTQLVMNNADMFSLKMNCL